LKKKEGEDGKLSFPKSGTEKRKRSLKKKKGWVLHPKARLKGKDPRGSHVTGKDLQIPACWGVGKKG